jgi:hypothetical protein
MSIAAHRLAESSTCECDYQWGVVSQHPLSGPLVGCMDAFLQRDIGVQSLVGGRQKNEAA